MLNKSCKSGYPCFIPDLKGKAPVFPPLKMILAVSFSYMAFSYVVYWRMFPLNLLYWGFVVFFKNQEWLLYFVKFCVCVCWNDHMVLILSLIDVMYHTDWFVNIDPLLQPGINTTWSWWMIFLMYCWIWFANILLRIYASKILVCNSLF